MGQTNKASVQSLSFPSELACFEVLNQLTFVLVEFHILQEVPVTSPLPPWCSLYWPQEMYFLYLPKDPHLLVLMLLCVSSP